MEVFINLHSGNLYPCEITNLFYNFDKDIYLINFHNILMNEDDIGILKRIDSEFYYYKSIDDETYHELMNDKVRNEDISILGISIPNLENKRITNNFENNISINKYLELESYSDILKGVEYLYFKILDVSRFNDSFKYVLELSCRSNKILNKNVVSRHKTTKSLEDIFCDNGKYIYISNDNDSLKINPNLESIIVNDFIKINKVKNRNVDSTILTKIARILISEDNYYNSSVSYDEYLDTFYDTLEKKKYR